MFCLKWFKTRLDDKTSTEKLSFDEEPEGPIMNMPDLVMRKIMENVDFITMLKLRKVCHAFRTFIDDTKLDNELTQLNIDVTPSAIYATIDFALQSKESVNFYYIRYGHNYAFFNDFGFILRNQSKPLKYVNVEEWSYNWYEGYHYDINVINSHRATYSIYGCCTSSRPFECSFEATQHMCEINDKCTLQPIADKFHDRFDCILKSRKYLIPIQNLEMDVLRPSNFWNMTRLIDMKQLKGIVIRKTYEENDKENGKQLVLNEIVELDVFDCIQELSITVFKVTVPLETFLHIPDLTVSISTITIEDVLLIKKNMLTSPTAKSRIIYFDHIKDVDTIHNTLGHANPDYNKVCWYFKLPDSDQALRISRDLYGNWFSLTWIETLWIRKDAVIY
ncbi:hypothetical protein GCK72_011225 [Caenorhabditis remanei]|uniref:F-box domain-containing protein n=1 Tax=Caenorhabditis remanei TaxID=31234 RepID=A0A6A5H539_CAERE|nr:hypothetical protein GCK72_011225 [Caenorhabditis remanei]KAF1762960.1 hypothetical protein GCK72_011225 [Caenorhabditis remanei]